MLRTLALLSALAASGAVQAQALSTASQQVSATAPQLVQFSGSQANFEAIVNGLTQGVPVTIITVDAATGTQQTVTFTPPATLTAADAARVIEAARNNLITRGVATPTAQQIATALVGGPVATPAGTVTLTPAIPGTSGTTLIQVRNDVGVVPVTATGATSVTGNNLQSLRTSLAQAGLSPFEVNQALQLAATILAQNGIVAPTAEQLQTALVGGNLLLPNGSLVPLQGVLQGRLPAGTSLTTQATLPTTATPTSSGFQIPTPTAPTAGTPQFGSAPTAASNAAAAAAGGTAGFRVTR